MELVDYATSVTLTVIAIVFLAAIVAAVIAAWSIRHERRRRRYTIAVTNTYGFRLGDVVNITSPEPEVGKIVKIDRAAHTITVEPIGFA